jgi:hypothetical protein
MYSAVKVNANGKPAQNRKGEVVFEENIREQGCANLEWLKRNKLTAESKPADWIDSLLH